MRPLERPLSPRLIKAVCLQTSHRSSSRSHVLAPEVQSRDDQPARAAAHPQPAHAHRNIRVRQRRVYSPPQASTGDSDQLLHPDTSRRMRCSPVRDWRRACLQCSEAYIAQASVRSDRPCGPRRWACRAHPSGSDVDTDPRTHFAADLAGVLELAQHPPPCHPRRLID